MRINDPLSDPMDVIQINLVATTFRVWDGTVITIQNYMLQSYNIFNLKR